MLQYTHIDMNGNEIQNVNLQNLAAAPASASAGRFYFNTVDGTMYVFDGTEWKDALNQGKIYTFTTPGLTENEGVVTLDIATASTIGGVKVGTNIAVAADGTISVADASTTAKGLIEIATDAEAQTGTAENLAVNPKQLAAAITGFIKLTDLSIAAGSGNYLAYDNTNGQFSAKVSTAPATGDTNLITSGGVFTNTVANVEAKANTEDTITVTKNGVATDITIDKVGEAGTLTGLTATVAELNYVDGVTSAIQDQLDSKIGLDAISIDTGSTNYLGYDAATGKISAKVDTAVTADSTNLITSGAVHTAIDAAIIGGVKYIGTWDATGQTDYSGIALPVKKGYLYYVSGGSDVTIGGITWNAGDYLLVNADVAAGGTLTDVAKIDNTEAADIVRLNATQTLTNKTISANDNTISDLAVANFGSGVIQTAVRADGTATDTAIATEKAVRDLVDGAVEGMVTVDGVQTLTNKTVDADNNTISNLETDNFKAGVVQTEVRATTTASDTALASEKAIATALADKVEKFTAINPALTVSGGVCTWTIANAIASADVQVVLYRTSDNVQVRTYVETGANNIIVKFNAAADIDAGTFKAVVLGL